jgi:hypothetical protein
LQLIIQGQRSGLASYLFAVIHPVPLQESNSAFINLEIIKRKLVLDPQTDYNCKRHTHGQTHNIYERESFIS